MTEMPLPESVYVRWEDSGPAIIACYHSTNHPKDFCEYIKADRVSRLIEALRKIGSDIDCGCKPCTLQCRSPVSIKIELQARQEIANEALGEFDGH